MGEKQRGEACSDAADPLAVLRTALIEEGYRPLVVERYHREASRFLSWLARRSVPLPIAGEKDVLLFVAEDLAAYQKRHRRRPAAMGSCVGSGNSGARIPEILALSLTP